MIQLFRLLLTAFAASLLFACQPSLVKEEQKTDESQSAQAELPLPFARNTAGPDSLDEEIIYNYLAAEVSAQRGALGQAYDYYIEAAMLAKDPHAAEKATRIAIHLDDTQAALRATSLWVEYAPNSMPARQLSAILNLRNHNPEQALVQLQATLKIAEAKRQDGFLQIANLLGKENGDNSNVRVIRKLVAAHPGNAHAHYALGLVEANKKLLDDAAVSLGRAIDLQPDWDEPHILLAHIQVLRGDKAAARSTLEKAIRKSPKHKDLHVALGRQLVDENKYQEALQQFQRARDLDPDDLEIVFATGMLAMQVEDWDEARANWNFLRNAGDKDKYDEASYFLGQVEELEENYQLAIGFYGAVRQGRLRTDARLRMANLKAKTGQIGEARELFREIRVLDPDRVVDIYIMEAQMLREAGREPQALDLYASTIASYPDNLDLRYNRGLFAADIRNITLAEEDFQAILSQDPDNVDALNALGYTLADQTDRFAEAFGYIHKAYKLNPDSPAILDSLGWVYYRLGNHEEALKYLHKALSGNTDPEIAAHLGEVLWMTGKQDEARKIWQEALSKDPDSAKLNEVMQRLR